MINDTTHRDIPSLERRNPSQKCWETRTVSCNLQFTPQLPNFFVNIHRRVEQKTIPLKPHLLVGLPAASFNQNCCLSKLCAFRCLSLLHPFAFDSHLCHQNWKPYRQVSNLFVCCMLILTARIPIFPTNLSESSTQKPPSISSSNVFGYVWWILCIHLSPIQPSQLSPNKPL